MRKFNTKLPQQNPILCNLEEIIRQRIHGKPFLQERIFAEVAIDMRNVRRLLRLTDGVKQCSGGSLQKCRRALRTSTQPGIHSCLQFQVHLHDHNRKLKSRTSSSLLEFGSEALHRIESCCHGAFQMICIEPISNSIPMAESNRRKP